MPRRRSRSGSGSATPSRSPDGCAGRSRSCRGIPGGRRGAGRSVRGCPVAAARTGRRSRWLRWPARGNRPGRPRKALPLPCPPDSQALAEAHDAGDHSPLAERDLLGHRGRECRDGGVEAQLCQTPARGDGSNGGDQGDDGQACGTAEDAGDEPGAATAPGGGSAVRQPSGQGVGEQGDERSEGCGERQTVLLCSGSTCSMRRARVTSATDRTALYRPR